MKGAVFTATVAADVDEEGDPTLTVIFQDGRRLFVTLNPSVDGKEAKPHGWAYSVMETGGTRLHGWNLESLVPALYEIARYQAEHATSTSTRRSESQSSPRSTAIARSPPPSHRRTQGQPFSLRPTTSVLNLRG